MKRKNWKWFAGILFILLIIVGCSSQESSTDLEKDSNNQATQTGGELNIAINTQPATLDNHMNTSTITQETSRNIYEKLVELDSKYQVVPMLAESFEESEDGRSITFHLREGVKFHNGKEMKAEDVVASLIKWQAISTKGQQMLKGAEFIEVDEYTVELRLPKRIYGVITLFADVSQSAFIMPKEIAEAAGPKGATEYVGTGPFKFVEWKQDQYIHMTKYEDYQPIAREADGLAGKKEALVNDIYYHIVTDPSTRASGLQTGQYDIAIALSPDNYEQIANTPNLVTDNPIMGPVGLIMNKKDGLLADNTMRKAVNAALDLESIMLAASSNEKFFRLESSYMLKEQSDWYSTAGNDKYNMNDPKLAASLLDEAGYDGTPLRLITTRDYDYMYNSAVVIKEQLEKAGVNVKLDVYDWATVLDIRSKPTEYDAFVTGFPAVLTPPQLLFIGSQWPGWTNDPKISSLLEAINGSATQEEAFTAWDELQGYLYDYLPIVKFGDLYNFIGYSDKVKGLKSQDGLILTNTSISK